MNLRIVTTTEQMLELEPAWNALSDEPLQSFDWNFQWWQHIGNCTSASGNELRVYCYEKNGEITGIAPFFVDHWMGQKRLRFLGSGSTCTDYAQIIFQPECREDFSSQIANEILNADLFGMLELEGVASDGPHEPICACLDSEFWRYESELEPTWILQIPESWEQFLNSTKSSLRRKIRKAMKRLECGEVSVRSTLDDLDFDTAFDTLVELHQERFLSKGEPGVFSDEKFTRFLRGAIEPLCKKQRAEILLGYSNEESIVGQLYLIGDSGPQLYQSGCRIDKMNLEPGHLLFTHAVRTAIERGYRVFDFLRGNEPYKPFWGAVPQQLLKIRCVSKQILPTTINQTYRALKRLKSSCDNWRGNLLPLARS